MTPIELDSVLEFKVTQVLDSKLNIHRKDPILYYVHWSGYEGTLEEYLWLTTANLKNATKLVTEFHCRYSSKPGPSLSPAPIHPCN